MEKKRCILLMLAIIIPISAFSGCSVYTETEPTSTVEKHTTVSQSTADPRDLHEVVLGFESSGEVDRDDPVADGRHFEPVKFDSKRASSVNIRVESESENLTVALIAPNGSTISETNISESSKIETQAQLTKTANYTVRVSSNRTEVPVFYTLTVEKLTDYDWNRNNSKSWNQSEKYVAYGNTFAYNADSENASFKNQTDKLKTNSYNDYIILTYRLPRNSEESDIAYGSRKILSVAVALSEIYSENSSRKSTWIPATIYFRIENQAGQLYETNALKMSWINEYKSSNLSSDKLFFAYMLTTHYGPASPDYTKGGPRSSEYLQYKVLNRTGEIGPPERARPEPVDLLNATS